MDYLAVNRLDVDQAEQVVKGIVDGCMQVDYCLVGGETTEMADIYREGEYNFCGTCNWHGRE